MLLTTQLTGSRQMQTPSLENANFHPAAFELVPVTLLPQRMVISLIHGGSPYSLSLTEENQQGKRTNTSGSSSSQGLQRPARGNSSCPFPAPKQPLVGVAANSLYGQPQSFCPIVCARCFICKYSVIRHIVYPAAPGSDRDR